jgi:hypothetical protein
MIWIVLHDRVTTNCVTQAEDHAMTNQPNDEPTDVERAAQSGNNPVASAPGERTA